MSAALPSKYYLAGLVLCNYSATGTAITSRLKPLSPICKPTYAFFVCLLIFPFGRKKGKGRLT